jgi:hypothetical protein
MGERVIAAIMILSQAEGYRWLNPLQCSAVPDCYFISKYFGYAVRRVSQFYIPTHILTYIYLIYHTY